MNVLPVNFDAWKVAVQRDPLAAAGMLCREIRRLPEDVRRATLVELTSEEELARSMAAVDGKGVLAGVPYLVKDLFHLKGKPTRAGSCFLDTVMSPPQASAQIVDEVNALGAVCAGKTQLVEFAYGMTGENPHYGDCPHPHFAGVLSGGSSSGSAWAVGSGLVPLAFGTDTAGSIRVPAAFCGIYGIRLNTEKLSQGVFPLAPSYDTVGWFTNNAQDMQTLCSAWLGDTFFSARERALYISDAVPFEDEELGRACAQVANKLQTEEDPELSQWFKHSWASVAFTYFVLSSYEASAVHRDWLDPMRAQYDPVVWQRLDQGRRWSESELAMAHRVRATVIERFADYFETYEALVLPVTPLPSPRKGAMTEKFRRSLLTLNTPASLAGLPVLTLPVRLADGRSGGLQVIFPSVEAMNISPWLKRFETK